MRVWSALLGFLVTTAYWPGLIDAAKLPREAVVAIGVPLFLRVEPRLMDQRIGWLLLFGVAWAIGGVWARGDVEAGFWLLVLTVAFVAGAGLESLDGVMTGIALGLAVSAAVCVAQLLGWRGVEQHTVPAGLFFSREVLAELAAPVALWGWLYVRQKLVADNRYSWDTNGSLGVGVFFILMPAATLPLILCGERAAIFAAVAGGLYAWLAGRVFRPARDRGRDGRGRAFPDKMSGHERVMEGYRRYRRAFNLGLGVCVLASTLGVISLIGFGPARWATAAVRMQYWKGTAEQITLWGHGLGWFKETYPLIDVAHSDVLQMGAELGAGALFFLAIPVLCLWERRGTDAERAILVVICIESMVSFLFAMPANGFLAAVVTGYLGSRRNGLHRRAPCSAGRCDPAADIGGAGDDAGAGVALG